MTITEVISRIKEDKGYTDENLSSLKESVLEADITSFESPDLKEFIDFINKEPFDPRVQDIVNDVVTKMAQSGILSPCAGGCGPECAFHESEFGGV